MNNEQQITSSKYPQAIQQKNGKRKRFITFGMLLIGLLILGGTWYGGYSYGSNNKSSHYAIKTNSTNNDTTNIKNTTSDTSVQEPVTNTFHTVLSVGYPYNSTNTLVTKLGVPNRLQSVVIESSIKDPGYTDNLANKSNEEMGRWLFGNPALSGPANMPGELSIFHIGNDWLQETTKSNTHMNLGTNFIHGYDFSTPTKKAASLAQLKSDTSECAKNSKKGFTISGVMNVCYTPGQIRQAVGSYSPFLDLEGYGVVDGQKYVLFGSFLLIDRTYEDDEADKKANSFASGNIPEETKKLILEYVDALKNSTITSTQQ